MHVEGTLLSTLAGMRTEAPALVLIDQNQQLRRWSFAQLYEATQACLRMLAGLGLQPGQQLLCISGDCLQFFALLHASLQAGLVFVPLHADQDKATVTAALAAPTHAMTLVEAELFPVWISRLQGRVLVFDSASEDWLPPAPVCERQEQEYDQEREQGPEQQQEQEAEELSGTWPQAGKLMHEQAALLFHSSGSSGQPKAMRYSAAQLDTFLYWQQHLFAAFPDQPQALPASRPSARLNVLPLMHWGGLSFCLQAHLEQRCVWLFKRFSASALFDAVQHSGCQLLMLVPAMYRDLLPLLQTGRPPESLRYCLTMGEAMPPALLAALRAIDTLQLYTAYGMSEALSGLAHGLVPSEHVPPDSCGRHCFGELKLVDEQGQVAASQGAAEGELWVRNATVVPRYTDAALCSEKYQNGWYRSGDWFRRDAAGNYFFVARKDGMCVHNGRNVYPWQVEDVSIEHPLVAACLACPVQTRSGSRRLALLVVATPPQLPDAADLLDFHLQHGALHTAPVHVLVQTRLPLTNSGKPDRREAARLLQAAYDAATGDITRGDVATGDVATDDAATGVI